MQVDVRAATPAEYVTVRSILESTLLEVEPGLLRRAAVLVAVDESRVLGALVLSGPEVEAVAVRPGRRGQGIGSALVREATGRRPLLTAGFDAAVRPFYESLGFEVDCGTPREDGRCRGRLR